MKTISEHDLREIIDRPEIGEAVRANDESAAQVRAVDRLRLLWEERRFLFRISIYGLALFTLIAFLVPKRYESSAVLMPPDDQSSSGMMLAATLASKVSGGLGGIAGDMLGLKSSGDLFIAFSTANPHAADSSPPTRTIETMPNDLMDPLFTATVEATEEAIVNALVDNHDMTGRDGHKVEALPHDRLRQFFRRHR